MVRHVCENCKYYAREACFYNPPTCVVDMSCWKLVTVHPPVEPDDRCSKWEQSTKKAVAQ